MRLGLIVRSDNGGLGYQTRDYYKFLKPDKVILIDLSSLNGHEQHYGWYENAHLIKGIPRDDQIRSLLSDIDVLLTAETPYNLNIYKIARNMGVKTICVENAEFYDHIKYPKYAMPDLIIMPSVWKEDEIRTHAESRGAKVIQLHHPVDRDEFPFRQRFTNKVIHIAGKPATNDRNGTWDFMEAYPNGLVTTQSDDLAWNIRHRYRHSNVFTNLSTPQEIYGKGDVMVLPRRYGGNCLPLNEALSSGMPVIMPDISPNNHLLPKEWLVSAFKSDSFEPRGKVDIFSCNIDELRDRIEWVKANIETESKRANEIADTISWETLKPQWEEAIRSVL